MFLRPNFSIATLISMTLTSATVGVISLLPTVGSAQNFMPPSRIQSCAQLVQRLDLNTAQHEQATAICDRYQDWMTTESIAALRAILNNTQLEAFEQRSREAQRLINDSNGSCGRGDHISHPSPLPELKCASR